MKKPAIILFALLLNSINVLYGQGDGSQKLDYLDVFNLEYVSDPQISPDGSRIIYVRNFKDVMTDRNLSNLWIVNFDGSDNRPLTTGISSDFSPRWSPDGKRIVYKSNKDGKVQIYLHWLDDGSESRISNLTESPGTLRWSRDGKWIAFNMFVPVSAKQFVSMPAKPEGAKWNDPPKYIDKLDYRSDGSGYAEDGYNHLFVLSVDGGTPRQITTGNYDHGGGFDWSADTRSLVFSANRHENGEYDPRNSEVYEIGIGSSAIKPLTDRQGPDQSPLVSPDGTKIAYLGNDENYMGYQITRLYIMNRDGSDSRLVSGNLDRNVNNIAWKGDNKGLYFQYDDQGNTKIAYITLAGKVSDITNNVGGMSLGRPYSGGDFSIAADGRFAFTHSTPDHPADLASGSEKIAIKRLTYLNDDLFSYKKPGVVEEIWYESSFDGRRIQGWICKPSDFDPSKKYPLILEIHGGPFANYGSRFSMEVQLYAAAGYIVLYTNPRGSSSYGEEFGNLIHHNYPNQDYDDLMSGVDAVIEKGYINEDNLFVTGGSGGGVLSAWIVGKTDRFRAAVVAKPVINWYSFVLTSDNISFYYRYWFPGYPWENVEHYMSRSPISLVGNVKTPTMLLVGESDYRTPVSETEQYYAALKLMKVETAMVRIPGASHGIASRPSNLVAKVRYILGWFEKYRLED